MLGFSDLPLMVMLCSLLYSPQAGLKFWGMLLPQPPDCSICCKSHPKLFLILIFYFSLSPCCPLVLGIQLRVLSMLEKNALWRSHRPNPGFSGEPRLALLLQCQPLKCWRARHIPPRLFLRVKLRAGV